MRSNSLPGTTRSFLRDPILRLHCSLLHCPSLAHPPQSKHLWYNCLNLRQQFFSKSPLSCCHSSTTFNSMIPKQTMPKSESIKVKTKRAVRQITPPHIPSKPYMRALRDQSPTSVPAAAWSMADDELLLRMKSSGKRWIEISPLFPGKTSNACRKRHARLVTHAKVEWDEFKERDLAVEFVNAKVGFFKMIAGNLKLEWRQVEKKV